MMRVGWCGALVGLNDEGRHPQWMPPLSFGCLRASG